MTRDIVHFKLNFEMYNMNLFFLLNRLAIVYVTDDANIIQFFQ